MPTTRYLFWFGVTVFLLGLPLLGSQAQQHEFHAHVERQQGGGSLNGTSCANSTPLTNETALLLLFAPSDRAVALDEVPACFDGQGLNVSCLSTAWFSWTAPSSSPGNVTIHTCQDEPGTASPGCNQALAVYASCDEDAFVCNDDAVVATAPSPASVNVSSSCLVNGTTASHALVSFPYQANATYHIQVLWHSNATCNASSLSLIAWPDAINATTPQTPPTAEPDASSVSGTSASFSQVWAMGLSTLVQAQSQVLMSFVAFVRDFGFVRNPDTGKPEVQRLAFAANNDSDITTVALLDMVPLRMMQVRFFEAEVTTEISRVRTSDAGGPGADESTTVALALVNTAPSSGSGFSDTLVVQDFAVRDATANQGTFFDAIHNMTSFDGLTEALVTSGALKRSLILQRLLDNLDKADSCSQRVRVRAQSIAIDNDFGLVDSLVNEARRQERDGTLKRNTPGHPGGPHSRQGPSSCAQRQHEQRQQQRKRRRQQQQATTRRTPSQRRETRAERAAAAAVRSETVRASVDQRVWQRRQERRRAERARGADEGPERRRRVLESHVAARLRTQRRHLSAVASRAEPGQHDATMNRVLGQLRQSEHRAQLSVANVEHTDLSVTNQPFTRSANARLAQLHELEARGQWRPELQATLAALRRRQDQRNAEEAMQRAQQAAQVEVESAV